MIKLSAGLMTNNGTCKYNYLARRNGMLKTKLFFDIKDNEYFDRLKQYILANYGMYFEITNDREESPGICTVSDYINRRNKKDIFLIKEEKGDISKFSGASEICSALMKMNNPENEKLVLAGNSNPYVICVTSAAGGAGKSTVAQAMCCNFALKGRKVLYFNFNPFSSNELIFKKNGKKSFTRFRYYLKKPDSDITAVIKNLVARDAEKRVDYIVNDAPSADGFISREEAFRMMDHVKSGCMYDVIVFDVPSYPGEGHIEVMRHAGKNFLIYSCEPDEKHSAFRKFLEDKGVNYIVSVANFTDSGENSIPRAESIFSSHPEDFWDSIAGLCKAVEENNDPGD